MKPFIKSSLVCAFCTAVLLTGGSMRVFAQNTVNNLEPHRIQGTVTQVSGQRIDLNQTGPEAQNQEIILNISDEQTRILDAVSGNPVPLSDIKTGDTIYAYIGPAMTLSLPPMTNATLILTNIPADFKVPEYLTVQSLALDADQTGGVMTATNGQQYTITSDTQIFPYLTRNIVTIQDLTPGTTLLLWSQPGSNTATKIMIFPSENQSGNEGNQVMQTGWVMHNGVWYYYNSDGTLHTGWLYDHGTWYYLDPSDGAMRTGFLTLGGNTYYLQEDGKMLTTPRTFTPDANGVLH